MISQALDIDGDSATGSASLCETFDILGERDCLWLIGWDEEEEDSEGVGECLFGWENSDNCGEEDTFSFSGFWSSKSKPKRICKDEAAGSVGDGDDDGDIIVSLAEADGLGFSFLDLDLGWEDLLLGLQLINRERLMEWDRAGEPDFDVEH